MAHRIAALFLLIASPALAQVQGTLFSDTTWSGSVTVAGDVTVNAGVTLTILPGTTVTFAATDALGSGASTTKTELIVNGTLNAQGTAGSPIVFAGATTASTSVWYGVRVLAGTATISNSQLSRMSNGIYLNVTSSLTSSAIASSAGCVSVLGSGNASTISGNTFTGCTGSGAVHLSAATTATVSANVFTTNYRGIFVANASPTIDHNTIHASSQEGIYLDSNATAATITNNVITNNSGYGIYRYTSSTALTINNNDIWSNSGSVSATQSYNLPSMSGSISLNPLYVAAPGNLRLTSNSPARKAGSGGTDLGALPYVSDPTAGLVGALYSDTTLSGTQTLAGDLIVPVGVTLTLQPGTTFTAAASDQLGGGSSSSLVEIVVHGTLLANAASGSPIIFTGQTTSSSSWYGIRVLAGGVATIANAQLSRMSSGVTLSSTASLTGSRFSTTAGCLWLNGSPNASTISGNDLNGCTSTGAIHVSTGAAPSIASNVITNSYRGIFVANASPTIDHNTIHASSQEGIYLDSNATAATITNNIITNNSGYGIYRYTSSTSLTINNNNIWSNSGSVSATQSYNLPSTSGAISANPLYVSAPTNLRLTSNSPGRKAGTAASDLGALPYTSDATVGLLGTLFVDTTLSGAQSLLGDLTVASGVTLTLQPGTSLTAPAGDQMGSGSAGALTELVVNGTLSSSGTTDSPIILTGPATSSSSWYGVRVLSGASATIANVQFSRMSSGVTLSTTASLSSSRFSSSAGCVSVNGSPNSSAVTGNDFNGCTSTGAIHVSTGAAPALTNNVFTNNYRGIFVANASPSIDHNSIHASSQEGIYLDSNATAATITNNIITKNSGYGIYRYTSSTSLTINNNDIWSNSGSVSATQSYNLPSMSGAISLNPLYVNAPTNLRLTANSPARKAGSGGTDLGALPYVSDPTTGLVGALYVDTNLSGPQTLLGDLIVPVGVTLTLAPGTTFTAAASDQLGGGASNSLIEVIVYGTLVASGSTGAPIVFTGQATSSSSWYGVRVMPGGAATIGNAQFSRMSGGVTLGATSSLTTSTFFTTAGCVWVAGSPNASTVSNNTFNGCTSTAAVHVASGATPTIGFNLFNTNYRGIFVANAAPTIDHNTIHASSQEGIYLDSNATSATITNNAITNNSGYGIYRYTSSTSLTINNNDIWSNSGSVSATQYYNLPAMSGAISANPLYVAAGTDFHLTSSSPCRMAGSGSTDIGAYPYSVGTVDHITVTPGSPMVNAGATAAFSATAYDVSNNIVPNVTFTWSALPAAGTITQAGLLTASCTPGSITNAITASASGKSGSTSVTVKIGAASQVTVTPGTQSITAGATQQFSAAVKDSCNNVITGPTISWSSTQGTITSSGLLTAPCVPGTYSNAVTASASGANGLASITVTLGPLNTLSISPANATVPAGGAQQFTATGTDSCGNPVSTSTSFTTTVPGGSVSAAGLFTAGGTAGTFNSSVTVSAGGKSASANITVQGGAVSAVTVTPNTATLAVGGTQTFSAVAKDGSGNVVSAGAPSWAVSAGGGAISSTGAYTAGATAGSFTVTATIAGVSGTAAITLQPGAPSKLNLSPLTATLAPGGMTTFSAQVTDASNNPTGTPVVWSVQTAAAGSITPGGVFTAGASVGNFPAAVKVSAGALVGTADISIQAGALSQLVLAPSVTSVAAGGMVGFSATGKDGNGNAVAVTPTWSVVAGGGTINATTGVFTAGSQLGTFVNTVQAQASGLSATATVTVTAGPVVQVEVTPNHPSVQASGTVLFTAKAIDAFGNSVPAATFVWSALPAAGTITPAGQFTAGLFASDFAGAVTATAGAVSGSASVQILGGLPVDGGTDAGTIPTQDAGVTADAGEPPMGLDGGTRVDFTSTGSGCACQSSAGAGSSAAWMLLAGLGLVLARRRSR